MEIKKEREDIKHLKLAGRVFLLVAAKFFATWHMVSALKFAAPNFDTVEAWALMGILNIMSGYCIGRKVKHITTYSTVVGALLICFAIIDKSLWPAQGEPYFGVVVAGGVILALLVAVYYMLCMLEISKEGLSGMGTKVEATSQAQPATFSKVTAPEATNLSQVAKPSEKVPEPFKPLANGSAPFQLPLQKVPGNGQPAINPYQPPEEETPKVRIPAKPKGLHKDEIFDPETGAAIAHETGGKFVCKVCGHKSDSLQGHRTHMGMKHKDLKFDSVGFLVQGVGQGQEQSHPPADGKGVTLLNTFDLGQPSRPIMAAVK